MKIYIVTSGCYSEYGIDAVFLDKTEAEKYIAVKNEQNSWHDSYCIEEYESQDGKIDIGNNVIGYEYNGFVSEDRPLGRKRFIVDKTPEIIFKSEASEDWHKVWLEEENYELAKKILFDRITQRIAMEEGL